MLGDDGEVPVEPLAPPVRHVRRRRPFNELVFTIVTSGTNPHRIEKHLAGRNGVIRPEAPDYGFGCQVTAARTLYSALSQSAPSMTSFSTATALSTSSNVV